MSAESINGVEKYIFEWAHHLAEGTNPYDQMTEEKIKEIYALAYFLYREHHYLEASHFFRVLLIARPSDSKNWKGLGASLQMQNEYEEALNCYMSAQMLNSEKPDPYIYLHAADCYFALKEEKAAFKALDAARKGAEKINDKHVLQHVKLMCEFWSKPKEVLA